MNGDKKTGTENIVWKNISNYPDSLERYARKVIRSHNTAQLLIYGIVWFIFALSAVMIPSDRVAVVYICFWTILFGTIYIVFERIRCPAEGFTVCEDTVFYYNTAEGFGKEYRPPFVITGSGIKAVVYDNAEYIKGDRIYCINCRKINELILCISWSEEDDEVQEEYPDI